MSGHQPTESVGFGLFAQDLADAEAALREARKALEVATSRWVARQMSHAQWFDVASAYGVALNKRDELAKKAARPVRGPADVEVMS